VDKEKTKSLLNFGQWVWVSSILIFLVTQGDDILVGKLLGVAALGFYQLAYKISNMPATEITHVISQVTFPAYSKIQDNVPKLRDAYLKVLQLTVFLSFPVAGLIFVLAPDFTMIFLGEKWMPMVPAIQVLVFAGLIRSIAATQGNIFYAVGKPKIDTVLQVIRLAVLAIFIYPFSVKWGILGASIVVLMSIATATIGFIVMSVRITKCDIMQFAKLIILPFINMGIMVFVILKFRNVLSTGIWHFLVLLCTGTLLYLFITLVLDKLLNNSKLRFLIKDSLQLIRGEV
jgi:O-antigen/teichoic acid export membrane protein